MSNKIDLREPICRAFTTEPTTAGGAKLPVSGNFFLALITIVATNSLFAGLPFIFSHIGIVFLTKKEPKFFKIFISHLKFKEHYY